MALQASQHQADFYCATLKNAVFSEDFAAMLVHYGQILKEFIKDKRADFYPVNQFNILTAEMRAVIPKFEERFSKPLNIVSDEATQKKMIGNISKTLVQMIKGEEDVSDEDQHRLRSFIIQTNVMVQDYNAPKIILLNEPEFSGF